MTFPNPIVNDSGSETFSNISFDQIPRILTSDDYWASTSSWTNVSPLALSQAQDEDSHNHVPCSGMDVDRSHYAGASFNGISTTPNSNLAPNEDLLMHYECIDIARGPQSVQAAHLPAQIGQVHIDSFHHLPSEDNVFTAYPHEPHHLHQQPPLVHQDNSNQWVVPDHQDHTRPGLSLNSSLEMSHFSSGASTFLNQTPGQEPWTLVHPPRGLFSSTTDNVIWDPETDLRCSPRAIGGATSPLSQSLSPLSADVHLSLSSNSHAVFVEQPLDLNIEQRHNNDLRMVHSDSSDAGFSRLSPSPSLSFTSSYQTTNVTQCGPGPTVKLEFASTYTSSASSNSPTNSHTAELRRQSAESPDRDSAHRQLARQSGPQQLSNKAGGRPLGSHLQPEVAADANMMRKVVACWHCVLQRDKCGPGETCDRCRKRSLRPNAESGLGCIRTSVRDLTDNFLPLLMTASHKHDALKSFCAQHVGKWESSELTIELACGRNLPPLTCRVYEFTPLDKELLRSFQYIQDSETGGCTREEKWSPPLGIQQQSNRDEQAYDRFINDIVSRYLTHLAHMLYEREVNDFALKLLLLMINLRPKEKKEEKILKEIFRLIVVTYVMAHSFVIIGQDKETLFSRLKSYRPGTYPYYCSPRMTNRQMKFLFCHLHQKILSELLNKVQQIFHSSGKGSPRWSEAFCAVLGLAIANEEVQKCIHIIMDAKSATGELSQKEAIAIAKDACKEIDQSFLLVMNIFRWKYSRGDNPLRDCAQDWSTRIKDPAALDFTRSIVLLVTEKLDYLRDRQYIDISDKNQGKYTSRLVARFLLSFWNPT